MIQSIVNGLAEFYFLFNEQATFIICLAVALVAFAVTLALSIFLRGYGVKRKFYFAYFLLGVCFLDFGLEIAFSGKIGYTLALVGVSVCLLSIIFSVREKQVVSEEQRELVRFIDQKISEKKDDLEPSSVENANYLKPKEINTKMPESSIKNSPIFDKENIKDCDVDFSHVRQVVEKLSKVELSSMEKEQVQELENAVNEAEQGGENLLTDKINNGLSALLKIISNYDIE